MALVAGVAAWLLLAPTAAASTITVEQTQAMFHRVLMNFANLRFDAAPGEDNRLRIEIASKQGGVMQLAVRDNGEPLTAGLGCSGGGSPGSAAICPIHAPRPTENESGGFKGSVIPIPGTGWIDSMAIHLGDGRDAFDATAFTGQVNYSFTMNVTGGPGDDRIASGGGSDTIVPGSGRDLVDTNDGPDLVLTTAFPDGRDVYDLGSDWYAPTRYEADIVDYRQRTAPVIWRDGEAGAPGESDRLIGVEDVFGGSGDDVLLGNASENFMLGGPGDDLISGGWNYDEIFAGSGDDIIYGGLHPDVLIGGAGNDRAYGGPDVDAIKLGDGGDQAVGGGKRDRVDCGEGWDENRGLEDFVTACEALRLPNGKNGLLTERAAN
jgi:Ca2+-binding RTX toxin-like protein